VADKERIVILHIVAYNKACVTGRKENSPLQQ